jgi:IclR family acetate operon transcriptional repressor
MTDRTIVTADELRDELARVRGRGFAFEREEHAPGTYGVAAPIAYPDGEVLAAVSMSVPAHRWRSAHGDYTRALVAAAANASSLVCRRLVRHDAEPIEGRVVREVAAIADSPSGSR